MAKNQVKRWQLFTKLSFALNIILAAGKLLLGLFSMSAFLCLHAFYSAGLATAKGVALQGFHHSKKQLPPGAAPAEIKQEHKSCFRIGLSLVSAGAVYILYSTRMFLGDYSPKYTMLVSVGIAAVTFAEIGVALYGLIATRKFNEPIISATKKVNFCSAVISLALTQAALLSVTQSENVLFYNGLMGLIGGVTAAALGLWMMLSTRKKMAVPNQNHCTLQ